MDGGYYISHRALRSVSLAVLLTDDLTGKPVTGSNARAWIENAKPPIKKNDGWFVFTDLENKEYTLLAEGGHYQRSSVSFTAKNGPLQTMTIRLRPARTYPAPPGCLRIEGQADPETEIIVYVPDKQSAFKLLADAPEGTDEITVFHSDALSLEGGMFCLLSADGSSENFTIKGTVPGREHCYRIDPPLSRSYPRVGSYMVASYAVSADSKGKFFLILKDYKAGSNIVFLSDGGRKREFNSCETNCLCPDLTKESL